MHPELAKDLLVMLTDRRPTASSIKVWSMEHKEALDPADLTWLVYAQEFLRTNNSKLPTYASDLHRCLQEIPITKNQ